MTKIPLENIILYSKNIAKLMAFYLHCLGSYLTFIVLEAALLVSPIVSALQQSESEQVNPGFFHPLFGNDIWARENSQVQSHTNKRLEEEHRQVSEQQQHPHYYVEKSPQAETMNMTDIPIYTKNYEYDRYNPYNGSAHLKYGAQTHYNNMEAGSTFKGAQHILPNAESYPFVRHHEPTSSIHTTQMAIREFDNGHVENWLTQNLHNHYYPDKSNSFYPKIDDHWTHETVHNAPLLPVVQPNYNHNYNQSNQNQLYRTSMHHQQNINDHHMPHIYPPTDGRYEISHRRSVSETNQPIQKYWEEMSYEKRGWYGDDNKKPTGVQQKNYVRQSSLPSGVHAEKHFTNNDEGDRLYQDLQRPNGNSVDEIQRDFYVYGKIVNLEELDHESSQSIKENDKHSEFKHIIVLHLGDGNSLCHYPPFKMHEKGMVVEISKYPDSLIREGLNQLFFMQLKKKETNKISTTASDQQMEELMASLNLLDSSSSKLKHLSETDNCAELIWHSLGEMLRSKSNKLGVFNSKQKLYERHFPNQKSHNNYLEQGKIGSLRLAVYQAMETRLDVDGENMNVLVCS